MLFRSTLAARQEQVRGEEGGFHHVNIEYKEKHLPLICICSLLCSVSRRNRLKEALPVLSCAELSQQHSERRGLGLKRRNYSSLCGKKGKGAGTSFAHLQHGSGIIAPPTLAG